MDHFYDDHTLVMKWLDIFVMIMNIHFTTIFVYGILEFKELDMKWNAVIELLVGIVIMIIISMSVSDWSTSFGCF